MKYEWRKQGDDLSLRIEAETDFEEIVLGDVPTFGVEVSNIHKIVTGPAQGGSFRTISFGVKRDETD